MAWSLSLNITITPVSFKVANLQGELQKGSTHVNRMKQYFTYDDPPTDSHPHNNSNEPSPSPTLYPQALVTEPPSTESTTPDAVEALKELNPLLDLMNSTLNKQANNEDYQLDTTTLPNCVTIHNEDQQLDINTIPDCVTNRGKLQTAHSIEKKTPASDHALSDGVITRGKETAARSG